MDAKQYMEEYAKNKHPSETGWLEGRIKSKINSVGGLLSQEAAMMIVAGEHGWAGMEHDMTLDDDKTPEYNTVSVESYTDLSNDGLDLIWGSSTLGNDYRKYPKEPLVVKVVRVYDAKKPEYGFAKMQTGVKITDGTNETFFNFEDKERFDNPKNGKSYPANMMSSAVQQVRQNIIGKTIAIFNWELFKGQNFAMTSTAYTYFKVVDDPVSFDEITTEEVAIEETEGI